MVHLLRIVLLFLIACMLVGVVVGMVNGTTGLVEKVVLAAVGVVLVLAATRVRHWGDSPRSSAPTPG